MKTIKDYFNSNANTFDEFFRIGDIVGKDVVDEFKNVLPPATDNAYLMQMGEPYSHIGGKATYMTFVSTPQGWQYRGNCFKGEMFNPFTKWLDAFLEEKGLDLSEAFKQTNEDGISKVFSYHDIVYEIKNASEEEQNEIQSMLIKIDFSNGNIKDFLKHLSKALIPSKEEVEELESIYGKSIGIEIEKIEDLEKIYKSESEGEEDER